MGGNPPASTHETTRVASVDLATQQSQPPQLLRQCTELLCGFSCITEQEYKSHMQIAHGYVYACGHCIEVFKSRLGLEWHISDTGHASLVCNHENCGKIFSRVDTYQRHQRNHQKDAKLFSCKYCKKYRGRNGFKRKDHLNQHIRNYHHIGEDEATGVSYQRRWCPKKECPESRPENTLWNAPGVFTSSKAWIEHMRTVHEESEFSCPQPGCDRINGKGYFRGNDLRAHLRKVHGTDGSFDNSIRRNLGS
jgi:hypothetical protein